MPDSIAAAAAQAATPAEGARQRFEQAVEEQFAEALAHRRPLSVLVAGLDGFRLVNDSLGPEVGDRILDEVRETLTAVTGTAHRLGGDVFGAAVPGLTAQGAVLAGERLREAVKRNVPTPIGTTLISVGTASYPESAASAAELIYGAQAALFWAKAVGGDKVGYWGELVCGDGSGWTRRGTVSDPVSALVAALERKLWAPAGQMARSAWYAKRVAAQMGLPPAEQGLVEVAALLHDVGKLAIPDDILLKPGPLTAEEKGLTRQHPLVGRDILGRVPSLRAAAPVVLHHHEHFDGSGYPDGLQGEDIPVGSRIILVSDAFDAMTTYRSYRSILSLQMAMRELERCGGQQFDPRVVEAFVQIVTRQGLSALHWSQGGASSHR